MRGLVSLLGRARESQSLKSEKKPRVIFFICDLLLSPVRKDDVHFAISNSKVIYILSFFGGLPDFKS